MPLPKEELYTIGDIYSLPEGEPAWKMPKSMTGASAGREKYRLYGQSRETGLQKSDTE